MHQRRTASNARLASHSRPSLPLPLFCCLALLRRPHVHLRRYRQLALSCARQYERAVDAAVVADARPGFARPQCDRNANCCLSALYHARSQMALGDRSLTGRPQGAEVRHRRAQLKALASSCARAAAAAPSSGGVACLGASPRPRCLPGPLPAAAQPPPAVTHTSARCLAASCRCLATLQHRRSPDAERTVRFQRHPGGMKSVTTHSSFPMPVAITQLAIIAAK